MPNNIFKSRIKLTLILKAYLPAGREDKNTIEISIKSILKFLRRLEYKILISKACWQAGKRRNHITQTIQRQKRISRYERVADAPRMRLT